MFVVSHAGHLYGPHDTANAAADFAETAQLQGPWHIVKLSQLTVATRDKPLTPAEVKEVKSMWSALYGK
jgi:hypothetical protein